MSGQKFSLSFTKKIEKKNLQPSAIRNDTPQDAKEDTEVIQSIEENVMKTDGKPKESELVIPMVVADRFSILRRIAEKNIGKKKNQDDDDDGGQSSNDDKKEVNSEDNNRVLTLDEQAEAAILEETKKKLEGWSERGTPNNLTILQTGQEDDKDAEMPSVGKESSLDDYDKVDVSVFGAALLRGMGWQKSEGIGRINKQVVDVIDPSSKTFGLANEPGEEGKKSAEATVGSQEEELNLAKGSFVFIRSGRRRGTYGIVESLDEDHLLLRTAVGQEVIREVELNIRVVSQREYKDSSRVINKDMYDKFKEEETRKKQKNKSKSSHDKSDSSSDDDIQEIKKEDLASEDTRTKEKFKVEKKEDALSLQKQESSKREESGNIPKQFRNKEAEEYVERVPRDNSVKPERENDRQTEKDRRHEKVQEPRKISKSEKNEDRYDRSNDKYKSSYHDKYKNKSKHYEKKYKERYSDHSDDKYSKKYTSGSEKKSQRKREVELNVYDQDYKKAKASQAKMPAIPWVRENLRVRLISKDYKGGKYHKEKVIVKCVETAESCECIAEGGKTLRGVHPGWLETVIPKVDPQNILIVKGNQKGQRGRILQLHKEQEQASIQLLEDSTEILKLHFDDICEYVSRY